jgi:NAD(P)-dependent dehydrogenase (short-subunit alcohol dehydrogenase family)
MPLAIVTGSNAGLGYQSARGLLRAGFQVVITSRSQDRADLAASKLKLEFPASVVFALELDLGRSASIDAFSGSFGAAFESWDVLVNNAGAKVLPGYRETDFGVEYHFGVNAVGHFAITADLLPLRAKKAKIVSVSSIVARFAPQQMGPAGSSRSYSAGASYAASKLSNYLFAMELENRFGSENFKSLAAHPGFARAEPYGPTSTRFFESFLAQSAQHGAQPIIDAALNDQLPGGSYRVPAVLELWGKPTSGKIPKLATSENLKRNWEILENLSGRKLVL